MRTFSLAHKHDITCEEMIPGLKIPPRDRGGGGGGGGGICCLIKRMKDTRKMFNLCVTS